MSLNDVVHTSVPSEHSTKNSIFVSFGMLGATWNLNAFSSDSIALPPIEASVSVSSTNVMYSDSVESFTVTLLAGSEPTFLTSKVSSIVSL